MREGGDIPCKTEIYCQGQAPTGQPKILDKSAPVPDWLTGATPQVNQSESVEQGVVEKLRPRREKTKAVSQPGPIHVDNWMSRAPTIDQPVQIFGPSISGCNQRVSHEPISYTSTTFPPTSHCSNEVDCAKPNFQGVHVHDKKRPAATVYIGSSEPPTCTDLGIWHKNEQLAPTRLSNKKKGAGVLSSRRY